jgi:FKBP-type peptidyl-prolyl cis-trans isomerase
MIRTCRGRAAAATAAALFAVVFGLRAHAEPTPPASSGGPPPLPAMIEWHTTPLGVKYAEVVVGTGASPRDGQVAVVHFIGWLEDGKQFDNSRERSAKPFGFPLGSGQVIGGWDEGVRGMRVGGTRRLIVPPSLGYGSRGVPGKIPPDATLTFDIQLLGVVDK